MDNLAEGWSSFICSSKHAERFLYPGGSAAYAAGPVVDEERVQRFCERLSRSAVDTSLLARLYLLLSPASSAFFVTSLSSLLRSASHATTGKTELSRRGIRGKVLWPQTLRSRAAGKADASAFVVRRAIRSADLPENRLLKLFLTEVVRAVDATAKEVGTGAVLDALKHLRREAATALNTPYLKAVTMVRSATALMRRRARRNRNRNYRLLVNLQADFDAATHGGKWVALYRLLKSGWFKPVNKDDLFELYILVLVLDVLGHELKMGEPLEYGLIRTNRTHVARFERCGVEVTVYFDQTPKAVFGTASEYGSLRNYYSFPHGNERRPDLILQVRVAGQPERRVIVEAKETTDDSYMRGSVYKVFGYLYDFQSMWSPDRTQTPKAILVFPEGVHLLSEVSDLGREVAMASGGLAHRDRIAELLKQVVPT